MKLFPSWMGVNETALAGKTLRSLILPGTHDSGTFSIDKSSRWVDKSALNRNVLNRDFTGLVGRASEGMARCQSRTIQQQLEDGIRFLDLRISPAVDQKTCGDFQIIHSLLGGCLKPMLEEVKQFLDTNKKEIVIIDFHQLQNDANPDTLYNMLGEVFGELLLPFVIGNQDMTIGEQWRKNWRLVVFMDKATNNHYTRVWPKVSHKYH